MRHLRLQPWSSRVFLLAVQDSHVGRDRLKGRRRRSNRPGNSQANGPRDVDSIWKETPRGFGPDASADGIILSGTATDGAFCRILRGILLVKPRGLRDASARRTISIEAHSPARPASGARRQDGAVRG